MRRLLLSSVLLLATVAAWCQSERDWQEAFMAVMDLDDDEQNVDTEELMAQLDEMALHPRDINAMRRQDWESVPFLTPQQVEQLVEYRERYGSLKSMGELLTLTALDEPRRQLLRRFFYCGDEADTHYPSLHDIARYGRHEVMGYGKVPFYKRLGDDNGYSGYPYKHWLRYRFGYGDYLNAGMVASQDAGEPFFASPNTMGYDFYSLYVQVRHLGRLENMVVGSYKLSTGMGLVVNNGLSLGKTAMLSQLGRAVRTVRPHSSRSSADYFQGVAATVSLSRQAEATAFVSYRPMDATLTADGEARTIVDDGYHRTPSEIAKKHNTHAAEAGLNMQYHNGRLHLGATALYSHLDRRLSPQTATLYHRYYPKGRNFLNMSVDYSWRSRRLTVAGETAADGGGALATINSVSLLVGGELSLLAVQRFYSYRYTSLHARSLSNGSQVQNESGLLGGLVWTPSPRLRLMAYADYAYSPWARYRISRSSEAWDYLAQLTYTVRSWTLGARYRLRQQQRDNADATALTDYSVQRARLSASWKSGAWSSRSQADMTLTDSETGYMVSQTAALQTGTVTIGLGAGYFDTESYDSRVYLYEQGPQYTFSVGQFSGRGLRYWLMTRWRPAASLLFTAKVGVTGYMDRSVIGSGLQQVDASSMADAEAQLSWRF